MQTFSDQRQLLADEFQIGNGPVTYLGRLAAMAIDEAYKEIGRKHTWKYYLRRALINTNAEYTTGTVAYSSSTNVLTLTGGTWPSWVLDGEFVINQNVYKPGNVLTSTTLSFKSDRKPGADITAGTGFHLFQGGYVLPADFLQIVHLEEITRYWQLGYIKIEDYHVLQISWLFPGTPRWYTCLGNNPRSRGSYTLQLLPAPVDQRTMDMIYRAIPRPRTLNTEYQTGTATTVGTAVTLSGGAVTNAIEGCVIRFGTTMATPTGPFGELPAAFETTVQQWLTNTTFVLEIAPPVDFSAVKFSIEDPIDVDPIRMQALFNAMCATKFATKNMKDMKVLKNCRDAEYNEFMKAVSSNSLIDISELWTKSQYAPMNLQELTFTQARN